MTEAQQVPFIQQFFEADDIEGLFDRNQRSYDKIHVSTYQSRKQVNFAPAIELAMELPVGAFIAGGWAKSLIMSEVPKDYDIYFDSEETMKNLIRRIHNAPEGTFLHGYTSEFSTRDFASSDRFLINFEHPTKPPLQLIRIRWYARPDEAIDKFDFTACQFALASDLNLYFGERSLEDVRNRRAVINKVVFHLSSSLRLKRMLESGWTWTNGYYDTYTRDEMVTTARNHINRVARDARAAGLPVPENIDGYGAFETSV